MLVRSTPSSTLSWHVVVVVLPRHPHPEQSWLPVLSFRVKKVGGCGRLDWIFTASVFCLVKDFLWTDCTRMSKFSMPPSHSGWNICKCLKNAFDSFFPSTSSWCCLVLYEPQKADSPQYSAVSSTSPQSLQTHLYTVDGTL